MSYQKRLLEEKDRWKNQCKIIAERNTKLLEELIFVESLSKEQLIRIIQSFEGNPNLKEMLCAIADEAKS